MRTADQDNVVAPSLLQPLHLVFKQSLAADRKQCFFGKRPEPRTATGEEEEGIHRLQCTSMRELEQSEYEYKLHCKNVKFRQLGLRDV